MAEKGGDMIRMFCVGRRGFPRFGCLLALCLAVAGCGSDKKKQITDPPVIAQTSPANCLQILKNAYTGKSLDAYAQLFTSDFTFVFYSLDVANQQTPEQWGLADELESANNMFTVDTVQGISLNFVLSDPVSSGDLYPDTYRVEMTQINLRLDTQTQEGTALTVETSSGHSTFYFKEFPNQHPSPGTNLWKIYRWEDRGFGSGLAAAGLLHGLVQQHSWGQIKHLYL
jgi:hypothetical protein